MKKTIDLDEFRQTRKGFQISKAATLLSKRLYKNEADLNAQMAEFHKQIDDLQQKMFAHDRRGLLLVFQAMDAAGKDGTVRHVMKGINPNGVEIHNFKRPSDEELDHDFLWRCMKVMAPRGRVGIFNRSYYEEVLVCKVHPEIVTKYQRLPEDATKKMERLWERRYEDICNYERYLSNNGITVVKFFLNVSKAEQKRRFLERIETPSKNWKFAAADVKERGFWSEYMKAYEGAINATSAPHAPWYVVPADDKGDMRLIVGQAILDHMKKMDAAYPELSESQKQELETSRKLLASEK